MSCEGSGVRQPAPWKGASLCRALATTTAANEISPRWGRESKWLCGEEMLCSPPRGQSFVNRSMQPFPYITPDAATRIVTPAMT